MAIKLRKKKLEQSEQEKWFREHYGIASWKELDKYDALAVRVLEAYVIEMKLDKKIK